MDHVDTPLFATLRFECAATGKLVDYEVPGDADTLKDLWARTLLRSCKRPKGAVYPADSSAWTSS